MDKIDIIPENKGGISTLAVDGVIYGIVSGIVMFISLAALALLSGEALGLVLERFSGGSLSSPVLGLVGHLGVSAIYGAIFGTLIFPPLKRLRSKKIGIWMAGILYGGFLLFLAQIAILPGTNLLLNQFPLWQWAFGHAMYGVVLGGLFARNVD